MSPSLQCPLTFFSWDVNAPPVIDLILKHLSHEDLRCYILANPSVSRICQDELESRKSRIMARVSGQVRFKAEQLIQVTQKRENVKAVKAFSVAQGQALVLLERRSLRPCGLKSSRSHKLSVYRLKQGDQLKAQPDAELQLGSDLHKIRSNENLIVADFITEEEGRACKIIDALSLQVISVLPGPMQDRLHHKIIPVPGDSWGVMRLIGDCASHMDLFLVHHRFLGHHRPRTLKLELNRDPNSPVNSCPKCSYSEDYSPLNLSRFRSHDIIAVFLGHHRRVTIRHFGSGQCLFDISGGPLGTWMSPVEAALNDSLTAILLRPRGRLEEDQTAFVDLTVTECSIQATFKTPVAISQAGQTHQKWAQGWCNPSKSRTAVRNVQAEHPWICGLVAGRPKHRLCQHDDRIEFTNHEEDFDPNFPSLKIGQLNVSESFNNYGEGLFFREEEILLLGYQSKKLVLWRFN